MVKDLAGRFGTSVTATHQKTKHFVIAVDNVFPLELQKEKNRHKLQLTGMADCPPLGPTLVPNGKKDLEES